MEFALITLLVIKGEPFFMKRLFLSALLLLPGSLLLTGCGGGSGSITRGAHSVARVTLNLSLPSSVLSKLAQRAKLASTVAPKKDAQGRLIPTNAVTLTLAYNTVDVNGNVVAKAPFSPTPAFVAGATTYSTTITDLAAGVSNTITVALADGSGDTVANGSTTVNVAPGVDTTNQINITLQSTIASPITLALDNATTSIADSVIHTLTATIVNSDLPTPAPITTITPSHLTWTVDHPERLSLITNTGYTIQVKQLQPGPAVVTLTYTEPLTVTTNQTVATGTISLALSTVLTPDAGNPKAIQNAATIPGNVPAKNLYDVTDDGYLLFYDGNLKLPLVDATNTGYSRIARYQYGQPVPASSADLVDFDSGAATVPAATPTYVGPFPNTAPTTPPVSHMALFKLGSTPYWAVVSADGRYLNALPAGQTRYSIETTVPTGSPWLASYNAPYPVVDLAANGTAVYLLEKRTNSYQVDTLNATTGTSTGTITLGNLGFTPVSLASIATTDSHGNAETDLYLAGGGKIAQLKVVPAVGIQTLNSSFATFANVVKLATSSTDGRFVAALSNGAPSSLALFSTQDGTQIPLNGGPATTLNPTYTGLRLSYSGNNLYLLETDGTNGQVESYQIQ